MKKKLAFFIIADFERRNIKAPVILYENGAVEVSSILLSKKHRLGEQYYDSIKENLSKLGHKKTDLREDFYPTDYHTFLFEIVGKIIKQKTISVKKILKIHYNNEIEIIINAILEEIVCKRFNRLVSKAYKNRSQYNELLRRIG